MVFINLKPFVYNMCFCVLIHVYECRYQHATMHVSRSEDKLQCWSSPSILFETVPVLLSPNALCTQDWFTQKCPVILSSPSHPSLQGSCDSRNLCQWFVFSVGSGDSISCSPAFVHSCQLAFSTFIISSRFLIFFTKQ